MAVLKTNSHIEGKAELEAQEAIKKRAAKQAAKREAAPDAQPKVTCTVLFAGHEKISMGQHVGGLGEAHYEEGESFDVDLPIAISLVRRGFVSFDGARQAVEEDEKNRQHERLAALREKQLQERVLDGH